MEAVMIPIKVETQASTIQSNEIVPDMNGMIPFKSETHFQSNAPAHTAPTPATQIQATPFHQATQPVPTTHLQATSYIQATAPVNIPFLPVPEKKNHTSNPLCETLFQILRGMDVDTTFTMKELAPRCSSSVKRVTEPIRVYQAFGIISAASCPGKKTFQYKGYAGLRRAFAIGQNLIRKAGVNLERFRAEDPPSETQRTYFRELCRTGFADAGLPTPRQGLDSLIMQAWCFFILQLWLGETSCNRTDLMITVKATARESKSRPRTSILKACRPLCFHDIPLFAITSGNKPTCRWIGAGLQSNMPKPPPLASTETSSSGWAPPCPLVKVPLTTNPKVRQFFSSSRLDSFGDKKIRISLSELRPSSYQSSQPFALSTGEDNSVHCFQPWKPPFYQTLVTPVSVTPEYSPAHSPAYSYASTSMSDTSDIETSDTEASDIEASHIEAVSILLQLKAGFH
jgi:hypothetical protein